MMEGIYSAGQDTPSDAPPGHWSFVLAQRFERDNNLSLLPLITAMPRNWDILKLNQNV